MKNKPKKIEERQKLFDEGWGLEDSEIIARKLIHEKNTTLQEIIKLVEEMKETMPNDGKKFDHPQSVRIGYDIFADTLLTKLKEI